MSIEWLGLGTLVVTQCVNIKIIDLIPVTKRVSIRLITRQGYIHSCFTADNYDYRLHGIAKTVDNEFGSACLSDRF